VVEAVEGDVAHDVGRLAEAGREAQSLEQVEPLLAAGRLVVADHREEGNPVVVETPQNAEHPEQVAEVGAAVVKEVAGVNHRVHVGLDRVVDEVLERRDEIPAPLRRVVLAIADVRVGGVEQAGHVERFTAGG
jgi:hypothetical protein